MELFCLRFVIPLGTMETIKTKLVSIVDWRNRTYEGFDPVAHRSGGSGSV